MAEAYSFEKDAAGKVTAIIINKKLDDKEKSQLMPDLLAENGGPGGNALPLYGKAIKESDALPDGWKMIPLVALEELPVAKPAAAVAKAETKAITEGSKEKGYIFTKDETGQITSLQITKNFTPEESEKLVSILQEGKAYGLYENARKSFHFLSKFPDEDIARQVAQTKTLPKNFDELAKGEPGQIELAKKYIDEVVKQGGDLDNPDVTLFGTALMGVAYRNNAELISYLVDKGADINKRITDESYIQCNRTALQVAAEAKKGDAVKTLLDKGADPNLSLSDKYTVIGRIASMGNKDLYDQALEKGADISKANKGMLMQQAAEGGSVAILKDLIENHGLNPNETHIFADGKSNSALIGAVTASNVNAVTYLLSKDAVITRQAVTIAEANYPLPIQGAEAVLNAMQKHILEKQPKIMQEVDAQYITKEPEDAGKKQGASTGVDDSVRKLVESGMAGFGVQIADSAKGVQRPHIADAKAIAQKEADIAYA